MSYLPTLHDAALRTALHQENAGIRSPEPMVRGARGRIDVGRQARDMFIRLRLWRRARHPRLERFFWYVLKPLFALALILWYTPQHARAVRHRAGVPIRQQIAQQFALAFREWVNPRCYYFHEHYSRRSERDCDPYVMRHEIKEGLLKSLHKLRPKVHGTRINLGHKIAFAETCERFGLPTPKVVAFARRGRVFYAERGALDQDLFMKPEQGRGAFGARTFLLDEAGAFDPPGRDLASVKRLLAEIGRRSWLAPQIVQPKLRNHPDIADLAENALVTFRVFTCMDAAANPIVTHAMLRTISKLEPTWPTSEEYAAPIDLSAGTLGLMCGDARIGPDDWYTHHPETGAPVTDRVVPEWPAIHALALAAHRVFADRLLVGWDIALTPDGPTLIEGNSYPDTEFLQRVHREPIGQSPLGPLLAHHLQELAALGGRFRTDC